jgi:hypothetical protein
MDTILEEIAIITISTDASAWSTRDIVYSAPLITIESQVLTRPIVDPKAQPANHDRSFMGEFR